MAHPQVSQRAGTGAKLNSKGGNRRPKSEASQGKEMPQKIDRNVATMIRADVVRLKNRTFGIRDRLYQEYGLAGREAADVSIEARSGGEEEAFKLLRTAWIRKNRI